MPLVVSSLIHEVEYDDEERLLFVNLRLAGWYAYGQVPREVYGEFLRARSKGAYFNASIRGVFPEVKLAMGARPALGSPEQALPPRRG